MAMILHNNFIQCWGHRRIIFILNLVLNKMKNNVCFVSTHFSFLLYRATLVVSSIFSKTIVVSLFFFLSNLEQNILKGQVSEVFHTVLASSLLKHLITISWNSLIFNFIVEHLLTALFLFILWTVSVCSFLLKFLKVSLSCLPYHLGISPTSISCLSNLAFYTDH